MLRLRPTSRAFEPAVLLLASALASLTISGGAQPIDPRLITGTPTPSPSPTATPTPTPEPSALPRPSAIPTPTAGATPTPAPTEAPSTAVPALPAQPAPPVIGPTLPAGFRVPLLPRTPGRNTVKLVRILERVTEIGVPLQQGLLQGMGRFPVGGLAFYSDDWNAPRFNPFFHLHEGLDIFADFGTPVRSPDRGVVTRLSNGPIGGIAVWVTARDGVQYYFAHLQAYANGLAEGTAVDVGTVIGFVGDTGNASGGAPHLHFELHRGAAVPPKPYVDAWLAEAEAQAPAWVDRHIRAVLAERQLLRSEHALASLLAKDLAPPAGTPEYSILLTLLDPVGGSVGLLPDMSLLPRRTAEGSARLVEELIRLRVEGWILSPPGSGS